MKKITKTDQAIIALNAAHPISNRGHAFQIIANAGLNGSGAVFNRAVKAYEDEHSVTLGKSAKQAWASRDASLRAQVHSMSAAEIREHINSIDEPDQLFWAAWKVFKYESKFRAQLSSSDFAVHFK